MLKRHFMQESGYIEFLGRQRERKNIYRLQPEYVLPLTVVKNDFGYLLFSGNETGREGFRACIQHVADHYFDPHCDMGRLDIYECPVLEEKLPSFIDTVYAPFRYFPVNGFDFPLTAMSPRPRCRRDSRKGWFPYTAIRCVPTRIVSPVSSHASRTMRGHKRPSAGRTTTSTGC